MEFQIGKFSDFVKEGIVRLQKPDRERARFLMSESQKDYDFLKKIIKSFEINDENANSIIKLSYDALWN